MKLAEMICGNETYPHFPYRSSSQLTKFFIDLDLDFVHDGSTRHFWVQEALNKLNEQSSAHLNLPNKDLIKVITSLVNPDYFLFNEKLDHKRAVEDANKALKTSKLILKEKADGQFSLTTLIEKFISTELQEIDATQQITFTPL